MNFCQYIVDFHMEPGEDGDPIFCDKPAPIKWDGCWFCADHYDEVVASAAKPKGGYIYRQGMASMPGLAFPDEKLFIGVDFDELKNAVFSFCYGSKK
jgi:hypothetical protein